MDNFVPDMYQKSVFTINYNKLKSNGIKCLLFDLDNTLVPPSINEPTDKVKELFIELKDMGFKIIIVSNSGKKRLAPFKEQLHVDCSASSMKPSKKKFIKIMNLLNYNISEIAMIGDQFMTDILGGNRVGIFTILVNPISKKDFYFTVPNRKLESFIVKKLSKKGLFTRGVYYE